MLMPLLMVSEISPVPGEGHERQHPFLLLGMVDESLKTKIRKFFTRPEGLTIHPRLASSSRQVPKSVLVKLTAPAVDKPAYMSS